MRSIIIAEWIYIIVAVSVGGRGMLNDIYRLLYSFVAGRRILFLHGFQKKTQKTPRRQIELAYKRLLDFLKREAGERHQ